MCCRHSAPPSRTSDSSIAGYATAANAVPKMICSGSATHRGRHCTRSEAQNDTSTSGSSSACCSTRMFQGANKGSLVAFAMLVPMLYA
jgi:hypothetical protein